MMSDWMHITISTNFGNFTEMTVKGFLQHKPSIKDKKEYAKRWQEQTFGSWKAKEWVVIESIGM